MRAAVTAWYRVALSNSDVVARRHMELQTAFETLFLATSGRSKLPCLQMLTAWRITFISLRARSRLRAT